MSRTFRIGSALLAFSGVLSLPADLFAAPATHPVINEYILAHATNGTITSPTYLARVEVHNPTAVNYANLTLVIINGDVGRGPGAGIILQAENLNPLSPGEYDCRTITTGFGTRTFLIVENFSGTVGQALPYSLPGILNATPWTNCVDGVAVWDGGKNDLTFETTPATNIDTTSSRLNPNIDPLNAWVQGASRVNNAEDNNLVTDWIRNATNGAGVHPSFPATADPAYTTPATICFDNDNLPAPPTVLNDTATLNEGAFFDSTVNLLTVLAGATSILANDFDPNGDPFTVSKVNGSALNVGVPVALAHGTLVVNANGTFTYQHDGTETNADSFTYTAFDGVYTSLTATVSIVINPINNHVPVAVNDNYNTPEDTLLTVNAAAGVLANDTDGDSDPLTAVLVTGPLHGLLTLNADGSFTYAPAANYTGADSFVYKANDGLFDSGNATVSINVTALNDAPVAVDDAYVTNEDTALNVAAPGVLGNDTDVELSPLTASLVAGPAHGLLAFNADGSFSYTPAANYSGIDTFTYQANDGALDSNVATVTITVTTINDAPVAADDLYNTAEDSALNIPAPGVLGNDSDVDSAVLTAVLVTGPSHGLLVLNPNGSFTYTPTANYNGPDSFTYKANDGALDSNVATVTINVTALNDAPVAVNDAYATNEDVVLNIAAPGVLGNDTDVELSLLTATLVAGPVHGALTLNPDGSFTYTPVANYNGPDSFTYKANDGALDSNTATVSITVNPINDAPVAVADAYSTPEDTVLNVAAPGILGNDTDVEGSALSAVLVTGPANGGLVLLPNGSFAYTPNANYNGPDTFTYKANDGAADSNTVTVTITVTAVNDAPVAANDAYVTNEDTALVVAAPGVLGNDTDTEGSPLSAVLVATTTHGALTLNPDGSFNYTPAANYNGPDSFTYMANDGALDSNVVTVSITVNAVNDLPVATDDSYSTAEDVILSIAAPGLLANDTDMESALSAVLVVGPTHGGLVLNANGSFVYTPAAHYNGPDSFTYRANDGTADSNVATVSITVTPVNDAPVAVNDLYSVFENTVLTILVPGVLGNDTDVEASPLTAILVSDVTHGVLSLNANGSFVYTPTAAYNGADSFTYKVNDGTADSNVATVTINVVPVNDPPVAANDAYSTPEDTALVVGIPGVLGNDTDPEANPIIALLQTGPLHGALTLNANGSFTYTPAANYNGPDSFTYVANDGINNSNVATVAITVTPVNDAPAAANDNYSTPEDTALTVVAPGVLGNDSDVESSPLTSVLVAGPTHGALTLNPDGSFLYTPNANYNGPDSFTYQANDGAVSGNIATVNITVTPVNDAPVAVDDNYSTPEDTALSVVLPGVLGNDTDVDLDPITAVLVVGPLHGALTLNANGSFLYTPNLNYNGLDTFTYQANDGALNSNVATVTITVTPVNDAPVSANDAYNTPEDTLLSIAAPGVLANDTDVDANPLSSVLVTPALHGAVTLNADGSFTYLPSLNYNGPDSFTYKANDGLADSAIATVNITVTPVNDAPVAVADNYSTNEDTLLAIAAPGVLANDTDVELSPLTAVLVTGPAHGALTLNANGSFNYTPALNYNGPDSFTYKPNDGTEDGNTVTVSITVIPVNDPPVAAADAYSTPEDIVLSIAAPGVLANDTDVDGPSQGAILVTTTANGLLVLNADGSFTYTPNANFNGIDTFIYKTNDGIVDSANAVVTITVTPVNDAPVAANDNYATPEDTALVIGLPGVLANDTDVELSPLTAALVAGPAHGAVLLNADGSFTYTPNLNYFGPDSFTYTANDGALNSNVATVNITVNSVNDAPVATADAYSTPEDTALVVVAPGVLANDLDVETDPLAAVLVTGPANGNLTLNANGSFTYTPNLNYNGPDGFTYKANDSQADSNTVSVTITVTPVDDAPVAVNDLYSTPEDTALVVPAPGVLVNDSDVEGSPLTPTLIANVSHGALVFNPNGSFTYTPTANYNGPDSFTYQVSDGALDSNVATVNITVTPVNDFPVAVDDNYATDENTPVNTPAPGVLANDTDVDLDPLTVTPFVVASFHGASVTMNADGSFLYNPLPSAFLQALGDGATANDTFTYTISDGQGGTDSATVTVVVTGINEAPVATDDNYATDEDTVINMAALGILTNDFDGDGDPLLITFYNAVSSNGAAVAVNADGSFTYDPTVSAVIQMLPNGAVLLDTFTYTISDGVLTDSATVTITLSGLNDPPVLDPILRGAYVFPNGLWSPLNGGDVTLGNYWQPIVIPISDPDSALETMTVQVVGFTPGTMSVSLDGPGAGFTGTNSPTYWDYARGMWTFRVLIPEGTPLTTPVSVTFKVTDDQGFSTTKLYPLSLVRTPIFPVARQLPAKYADGIAYPNHIQAAPLSHSLASLAGSYPFTVNWWVAYSLANDLPLLDWRVHFIDWLGVHTHSNDSTYFRPARFYDNFFRVLNSYVMPNPGANQDRLFSGNAVKGKITFAYYGHRDITPLATQTYADWKFLAFGADSILPASAELQDINADGVPNLIAYALGFDPYYNFMVPPVVTTVGAETTIAGLPAGLYSAQPDFMSNGDNWAELTYQRNPKATAVTFALQYKLTSGTTWADAPEGAANEANPYFGINVFDYRVLPIDQLWQLEESWSLRGRVKDITNSIEALRLKIVFGGQTFYVTP